MSHRIYRVDFVGLDAAGAQTVFSYATRSYCTTAAHATLPNASFDNRLVQPLLLRRDLFGEGRTYGDVQIAHGTVVLGNPDGELDGLVAYGFDAQSIRVWRVDSDALDTDLIEFDGVMEQLTLDESIVTILVRDHTYTFDRALQPTKFAGTNVAPNGLEGTSDLKGRPKPILIGDVENFEPVLVNAERLIYQFHDRELSGWTAGSNHGAFDRGVALPFGEERTLAQMQAGATVHTVSSIDTATDVITFTAAHGLSAGDTVHVAATTTLPGGVLDTQYYYARNTAVDKITLHPTYLDAIMNTNKVNITSAGAGTITVAENRTPYGRADWCSDAAGGFLRLGSQPAGRVTANVVIGAAGTGDYRWYEVVEDLVNRVDTFSIDYRISDPDAVVEVGHYWTEETTVYEAVREVLRSMNASYQVYPNRNGTSPVYVSLQRLTSPAAPSRLDLDESNIVLGSLNRLPTADRERGIPPWRISVNYTWNYTVLTATDLAAAALPEISNWSRQYRTEKTDNAAIKLKFPAAPELRVDSRIMNGNDALDHSAYLSGLFSTTGRGMYTLRTGLDEIEDLLTTTPADPEIPGLLLCDVVKVTYPRFGFDAGVYLAVIGYTLDYQQRTVDLTLWG